MLKLDPIFSDHALIQHSVENTIKGWASNRIFRPGRWL